MTILETPAFRIGKHEWRAVVRARCDGSRKLTYEWRPLRCVYTGQIDAWRDYHEWPGYDLNDGSFGGMPRTVAKLYNQHAAAIKAAIDGDHNQPSLF